MDVEKLVSTACTDFSLDQFTWDEIAQMSNSGELKKRFKHGASKHVELTNGVILAATIIAFKGELMEFVPLEHALFELTRIKGENK